MTETERTATQTVSVRTPAGTLVAGVQGDAVVVDLNKDDGTSGQVAFIEATPEELRDIYPTPVHVFAYDGNDADPVSRTDVDVEGEEMRYDPRLAPPPRSGDDGYALLAYDEDSRAAIVFRGLESHEPYVACYGYDMGQGDWSQGHYFSDLGGALDEYRRLCGREPVFRLEMTREDIAQMIRDRLPGVLVTEANVDACIEMMKDELEISARALAPDIFCENVDAAALPDRGPVRNGGEYGVNVEFDSYGERCQLELVRERYRNGSLAVTAYVSDPYDEDFGEPWCSVSVNFPSAELEEGEILLDANNMGKAMLDSILPLGKVGVTQVRSGFCTYRSFKFDDEVMESMRDFSSFKAGPWANLRDLGGAKQQVPENDERHAGPHR
ncbi:DUF4313 domain-containing protein [Collinsella bouchesdurhonensis]|uniref:DUF4313 domain-containing protein n=1 Tax=Collinsella bouchesdurhonensis TaxID=1907654 RepID=UPI0034A48678